MTRGNQRENDRLRAQKKQETNKKKKKSDSNFRNTLEIQANIMRQKQKLADERKATQAINNTTKTT
ncbi:uncharacterized protein T551_00896 [Pneumocystis jirovecii RU7]|uniref:Small EDRK-rich factor-like N-terminal domain-containing protein n=1 Tax=Pneumocystis jirovecii (strain RU7) TaxID=1408657 RepID=A0A0W4ZV09_PNEJ7|nr:uncharacterized protein T551_00896 [Pneumocystis jirovecii RU7]KTW32214.1 hypothetical protein T551_00896 [Pneumocystis jirovecii RU7]